MKVCVTVDLDNYRQYSSLVDPGHDDGADHETSFYTDALPRFLDLFDSHGIRATFFVVGEDAARPAHRAVLRDALARGHELGNHSYSHPYNFRQLSREQKVEEIERGEAEIADAVGERPRGFRTPSFDVDEETVQLLDERGYVYDSSTFPTPMMWAFMLYGKLFVKHGDYQLGRLSAVMAPKLPYVPSRAHMHRRGRNGDAAGLSIVEIPVSVLPVLTLPFYSTLLRRMGKRAFSLMMRLYGSNRPLLHSMFHLIELAELDGTALGQAYEQMPGLSVSLPVRTRFLAHAMGSMAALGTPVTMGELAHDYRRDRGGRPENPLPS